MTPHDERVDEAYTAFKNSDNKEKYGRRVVFKHGYIAGYEAAMAEMKDKSESMACTKCGSHAYVLTDCNCNNR